MGQVVRLANRIRRNPGGRESARPLGTKAYYCRRCEADRFLLYAEGLVQCAGCGAQLENLTVAELGPQAAD